MTRLIVALFVTIALVLPSAGQERPLQVGEPSEYMGWVEMRLDGTLSVVIAGFDGEMFLDGMYELKPEDPSYSKMLERVGGLKYGRNKTCTNLSCRLAFMNAIDGAVRREISTAFEPTLLRVPMQEQTSGTNAMMDLPFTPQ